MNKLIHALASTPFRIVLAVAAVISTVLGIQAYFIAAAAAVSVMIMLSPTGNSAVLYPIAAATVVVFTCGAKIADIVPLAVMLIPLAASFAVNILLYRKRIARHAMRTRSVNAMIGVAIAVLIGGVGMSEPEAYIGWGAYYYLGLSIAPIGVYALTRLLMSGDDADRTQSDFIGATVFGALISAGVIFAYYAVCIREFAATHSTLSCFRNDAMRNQIAVFIVPASAVSAMRMREKKRYIAALAMLITAALLSSSRTSLLFSVIAAAGAALYSTLAGGKSAHKKRTAVIICAVGAIVTAAAAAAFDLLSSRTGISGMFSSDIRIKLWQRGLRDFAESPIIGKGILYSGNARYFSTELTAFSLQWYHNAAVQVLGSFGIIGVLAYGYQMYVRVSSGLRSKSRGSAEALALYLALILMSMTEPGLFCPFPTAFMPAVMFAALDESAAGMQEPKSQPAHRRKRRKG